MTRRILLAAFVTAIFLCSSLAAQTTAFTYQGSLQNSGAPVNGNYDFEFKLFDLVTAGAQQGSTIQRLSVPVVNGVFSVSLDFGVGTLPGADRFIEMGVRLNGNPGGFQQMLPRQQITSAPYAVRSLNAATADSVATAGGIPAGSGNYIQNGTSLQPSSNFNVSGTGNVGSIFTAAQVGVGTTNPFYPLEVVDFGNGPGLKVRATSTWTTVDIEGNTSDAAVRLARGGSQKWNMRVRETDNALEFFEMGGGGSRMIIEDATGSVGIGETANPTRRLHVLSSTTYGIRGETTLSSGNGVEGIANTGTAAYGIYGESTTGYAGKFQGKVDITGTLSKGAGSFKIDHPLDPENKYLYHSFVESPDMKNIYDGVVTLDQNGTAEVTLPDWFEALNDNFRYQLTAIGAPGPNLFIAQKISKNRFTIAGGTVGMEVSWQVTGIRKDAFANKNRIPVEENKPAEERGTYLYPEAFGQPMEKSLMTKMRSKSGTDFDAEKPAKPAASIPNSTVETPVMSPAK